MAKRSIEISDGHVDDDNDVILSLDMFDEQCDFNSILKSVEEKKSKLNSIIYRNKNSIHNTSVPNVDFVLSQISHTVRQLESSQPPLNDTKTSVKEVIVSKDFLPFKDLKVNSSDGRTSQIVGSSSSEKFESQWDCNTQLFQLADNADALISIIDSNDVYQMNSDSERLFERETIDCDTVTKIVTVQTCDGDACISTASNEIVNIPDESTLNVEKRSRNDFDLKSDNKRKLPAFNVDSYKNIDCEVKDEYDCKRHKESHCTKVENTSPSIKSFDDDKNEYPMSPIIQTQTSNVLPNKKRKKKYDEINVAEMIFSEDFLCTDPFIDDEFVGFTTVSNKKIKVSSEAVIKSKKIFDGIENDDGKNFDTSRISKCRTDQKQSISSNSDECFGFMTASNKYINVSKEALSKANSIFNDIDTKVVADDDGKNSVELTASNKIIKLSEEALNKAEYVFGNFDYDSSQMSGKLEISKNTLCDFQTASNKNIIIAESALKKVKNIFDDCQNDNLMLNSASKSADSVKDFCGFTTASNKTITISEGALIKAKSLFEECHNNNTTMHGNNLNKEALDLNKNSRGFTTASNRNIEISEDALKKVKNIFDEDQNDDYKDAFCGFTTASNKNIEISEDALKKVKNIFDEDQNDAFCGFTTASNKNVKISEDALKRVKNIFNEDRNDDHIDTFCGFTTASNKNIEISEDALKKVKNIFKEDQNDDHKDAFWGFTTASNKNIKVSEDALKKVKNIFDDCHEVDNRNSDETNRVSKDLNTSCGFTTANNKRIEISENALKKVKNLFEEFQNDDMYDSSIANSGAFLTANNKSIKISEDAVEKAKSRFEDVKCTALPNEAITNKNVNTCGFKTADSKNIVSDEAKVLFKHIENDSQSNTNSVSIRKNLHRVSTLKALSIKSIVSGTVWTSESEIDYGLDPEEIIESTSALLNDEHNHNNHFKSPSSPVLQMKRPIRKKNVFQVPYKKTDSVPIVEKEIKLKQIESVVSDVSVAIENCTEVALGTLFEDKINRGTKLMSLKDLKQCRDSSVDDQILTLTPQNYDTFEFRSRRLDVITEKESYSVNDIVDSFTRHKDVDEKLVPNGWVLNHIKWIFWKLASYERVYPRLARIEPILSASNVLKQLKYRYDRELYRTERPILRKILEKDEIPGKRMVLCVSNVVPTSNDKEDRLQNSKYELELTDGWYDVLTVIDPILSSMIDRKKIVIGTKLIIYGAELLNCPQGVAPLEDKGGVRLKICANSCRRCASWLKLGLYVKDPNRPLPLKLNTCKPGGGPLPNIRLIPVNIYPMLHLNKQSDGSLVMQSDKLQQMQNAKLETELQMKIEQLYNRVEKEFADRESNNVKIINRLKNSKNTSPEELIEDYESAADPVEFLDALSQSQRVTIQEYNIEKQAKLRQQIDDRVQQLMDELGLVKESAVKVLKARIVSFDVDGPTSSILTIWRPSEATIDLFTEGICLDATNLTPTGVRSGELHLSAGKRSTFTEVPSKKSYKVTNECTNLEDLYQLNFAPRYNEVHLVGIVVNVIPQTMDSKNASRMQTVYLANESTSLIAVNFWGGVDKYGFGRVIANGALLACSNLQYRPRSIMKRIRQLYVTELTNITRSPKQNYLQTALNSLENCMRQSNLDRHVSKCNEQLSCITNMLKENVKRNTLECKRATEEFNLSGLDFDSTFADGPSVKSNSANSSVDVSNSNVNLSSILGENTVNFNVTSPHVERRLNKLRAYGDPPPLSPIYLNVSSRLSKNFVSPCAKVVKPTSNSDVQNSKIVTNSSIDDDDFSPPLSLE